MASLSDLVPLYEAARAAGVPPEQIPDWIRRLNAHTLNPERVVAGQQEIDRAQQALQDAAAVQTTRMQTGAGLMDDARMRADQIIERQKDPDDIVAYFAAIAGLPEASATPVTSLIGQGFKLEPTLPSPYTDPEYVALKKSMYDAGRPRTVEENIAESARGQTALLNQQAADAYRKDSGAFNAMASASEENLRKWFGVPAAAAGASMMLDEPVVGVGAWTGMPKFTAAENGPEKVGQDGNQVRFTPMKGVSQDRPTVQHQQRMMEMAGVGDFAGGGTLYEPDEEWKPEDVGKTRNVTRNPTTAKATRPKFKQRYRGMDVTNRVADARAGRRLADTSFGGSTASTSGILPSTGNIQVQRRPDGSVQIVANPVYGQGMAGDTINTQVGTAPGATRQATEQEVAQAAAERFKAHIDGLMAGAKDGGYTQRQLAGGAMGRRRSLLEGLAVGGGIGGVKGLGGDFGQKMSEYLTRIFPNGRPGAYPIGTPGVGMVTPPAPGGNIPQVRQYTPEEQALLASVSQATPLAGGGTLTPVDATFDSLAKVLEKNPFAERSMVDAIRRREAPPPGSITQRFLTNSNPSVWKAVQAAIRGRSGGTFLEDYLGEVPKFFHKEYQTYGRSFV